MKQSLLFTKTRKDIKEDEKSPNASLLIRAGFIDKLAAGVYTYLPLGLLVLRKIENIIREEMNNIGGQEVLMPALTPKNNWVKTNRWDKIDVLFKLIGHDNKEYALGSTHEEVVTPLVKKFVLSYKDLPKYVYQIQTKFRNEPRAKSGLLRGREFSMKDLYSFHTNHEDLDGYYEKVKKAYFKIFERIGIKDKTHYTYASGGDFSKYSHEFQTITKSGEDLIYICPGCQNAYNKEIINEIKECQVCKGDKKKFKEENAVEVGNIFKLSSRFSNDFEFKYINEKGQEQEVIMGCYGLGPGRSMGTAVELFNDENGIIWPKNIAPYQIHLLYLGKSELAKTAEKIYNDLTKLGLEVLFDDREESAGKKLNDADLIGIPYRLVISEKTMKNKEIELKLRSETDPKMIKLDKILNYLKEELK